MAVCPAAEQDVKWTKLRLFMGISDEIEDATIAIDETKISRDWSDEATI